uniref:Uncharacterized protein n=1 Tax=Rhizophora mucronata TaxID=61149 RepID=A0A2P2MWH6_RHIMU
MKDPPDDGYIKGKMRRIGKRLVWEKHIQIGIGVIKVILNPERALHTMIWRGT